jgi:SOS response regulatory protein OraA/RecX
MIEQVTEELCQNEDKSALELLEKIKKRYKDLEPKAAKRRMFSFLLRRGFSYETIKKVLGRVNRSFTEDEIC